MKDTFLNSRSLTIMTGLLSLFYFLHKNQFAPIVLTFLISVAIVMSILAIMMAIGPSRRPSRKKPQVPDHI